MAHTQVADEGDSLQMWVAADILNKQSQAAEKGWFFSLRIGCGVNISLPQKNCVIKCHTRPWTWI
jgi:hypothetical protein